MRNGSAKPQSGSDGLSGAVRPESGTPETFQRSLGLIAVTTQGVAAIGLTATALVNIPQIFAIIGQKTWMAYGIASVVILLMAETIITFRKIPAAADGIAGFVRDRFGDRSGNLAAWALFLGYLGNTVGCLIVFGVFVEIFGKRFGVQIPLMIGCLLGGVLCYLLARRDVKLSAMTMLSTEFLSVLVILALCVLIFWTQSPPPENVESPAGAVTLESWQKGLMLAILSFVGFESTATLGEETINPLKIVPKSLRWTVWISAGLFVFWGMILAVGLGWLPSDQQGKNNALILLAEQMKMRPAAMAISLGGFVCFFGASLANLTALARVTFALAQHDFLPARLATVNPGFNTPTVALTATSALVILCCGLFSLTRWTPAEIFDMNGFFAVLGFLVCYIAVALTACFHTSIARSWHRLLAVVTTFVLLAVCLGLFAGSGSEMAWVIAAFVALFAAGAIRVWQSRSRAAVQP